MSVSVPPNFPRLILRKVARRSQYCRRVSLRRYLVRQRCTQKCLARVKRVVATSPDRRSRAVRHRGRYANGEGLPTEATAIYACGTPFGYRSGTGGSPRRALVSRQSKLSKTNFELLMLIVLNSLVD